MCIRDSFIFDLNTKTGLQNWNGINIKDTDDILLIIKGIFDTDKNEAITRVSGFVKDEDERYSRFEEIAYNYVYPLAEVKEILQGIGWSQVYFALIEDLEKNVEDPEKEDRIFVVAKK